MQKKFRGRFGLVQEPPHRYLLPALCRRGPGFRVLAPAVRSSRSICPPTQLLQQQYQQRQGPRAPAWADQPDVPQNVVIQPVQPENRVQLPPSRLEQIMSARAGAKLQQFGYDQLGSGRSVTVPQTGAVQDDYVLGPGDEIIVSLRGQENNEFRTTVDRNGQVTVPRLDPVPATGRSFGSFRQDVEAAVRRAYVATSAFVAPDRAGAPDQRAGVGRGQLSRPASGDRPVIGGRRAASLVGRGQEDRLVAQCSCPARRPRICCRSLRRAHRPGQRIEPAPGGWRPYPGAGAGTHRCGDRFGAPARHPL